MPLSSWFVSIDSSSTRKLALNGALASLNSSNVKIFAFSSPPISIGSGSSVKARSGGLSATSINSSCSAVFFTSTRFICLETNSLCLGIDMAPKVISAFLLACLVFLPSLMFDGCSLLFIQTWTSKGPGWFHSSSFLVRFVLATEGSSAICCSTNDFPLVWDSLTCESAEVLTDQDVTWLWAEIVSDSIETSAEQNRLVCTSPNEEFVLDVFSRHPSLFFACFTP